MALALTAAYGAPRVPASDAEVLEHLPVRAGDATGRELRALRAALAEAPRDPLRAVALARRYFDLASAEGDPRYIGYAEAAIRRWYDEKPIPVEIVFTRALLAQYRHDFEPAMSDLDEVLKRDPSHGEALSWKWALYMVQAEYPAARAVCEQRRQSGSALGVAACVATLDSINGHAAEAYEALSAAFARDPNRDAEYRQWILTRLGEFALRTGDDARAASDFVAAIDTGVTDGYVLAAYADLLLDTGRPAEVVRLLKDWTRSDILLLRLAIAEHALGAADARPHIRALTERFADSALRGDRLHLQEEARFELELRGNAERALALALEDWKKQREPRDARVLMESAIAARKAGAARDALEWMKRTGYQEPRYRALAATLAKMAP